MLLDVSAKESTRTRICPSASGAGSAVAMRVVPSWSWRTRRVWVVMHRTLNETACLFNTGRPRG